MVITTEHTKFGTVLVTGTGESLYVFSGDELRVLHGRRHSAAGLHRAEHGARPGQHAVHHGVAAAGRQGSVIARGGVRQKGLGTVTRNGVTQVTYFGQPVYGFIKDTAAGDINGEDVAAFDGMWYLVHPSGRGRGHGPDRYHRDQRRTASSCPRRPRRAGGRSTR